LGTNPEYAVTSTDRFLTSLSRIQVEINDQRKVPVLKFWVRRSPVRPLPPWAKATVAGLAQACMADGHKPEGNAEDGGNASAPRDTAADKGVRTNPECAPESTDSILTAVSRIRIGTVKTERLVASSGHVTAARCVRAPHVELSDLPIGKNA
jgi:hypothetical protein